MTFDPRYPPQHPAQGAPYPQGPAYPAGGYQQVPPGGGIPNYYGYQPGHDQYTPQASGVGMASLIIGVVSGIVMVVSIVAANMMTMKAGGRMDEKSPQAMGLGFAIILGLGANLIGAILGIVNLAQPNRKKLFGILGLIINGGILLFVIGLIVVGLTMAR